MRVSTVALYTLAALTAYELISEANASPISQAPTKEVETSTIMVPVEISKSAPILSVAPPEMQVEKSWRSGAELQHLPINAAVSLEPVDEASFSHTESLIAADLTEKPIQTSQPVFLGVGVTETTTKTKIASLQQLGSAVLTLPESTQISPDNSFPNTLKSQSSAVSTLQTADFHKGEVIVNKNSRVFVIAQSDTPRSGSVPSRDEIDRLRNQLEGIEKSAEIEEDALRGSPSLTIVTPHGFGADDNTGFVSATFQSRTRNTDEIDGGLGIGVGLGNARKAVGVELSYTFASFGRSRDFGSGGFNAKVHRRLSDDTSVAVGWNGFLNIGGDNDFENSLYGVITKIFQTRNDLNKPFSRIALTAGIGNGQFRTEDDVLDEDGTINVFGSVALRVARPMSLIAEWTGQDLGVGLSIVPFKNLPLVITPAIRDITGAGDGTRFVLGSGFAFKF